MSRAEERQLNLPPVCQGNGGVVTIAATRHHDRCRIVVTDNGEGFDPAKTDQIFERFCRGDSSRRANGAGSGIGLTIAKAITRAHRGLLLGHSDGSGTGGKLRDHPADRSSRRPPAKDLTTSGPFNLRQVRHAGRG